MRKNLTSLAILAAVVLLGFSMRSRFASPSEKVESPQNPLPTEIRKILETRKRFVFLSLEPTRMTIRRTQGETARQTFHDYEVLGSTEIQNKNERQTLLNALYAGIADGKSIVSADCFNPRHGISATHEGETVDLVLCFECQSFYVYKGTNMSGMTISSSPGPVFNEALKKARLPLASY